MVDLIFDMQQAFYVGIDEHPVEVMHNLNIKYSHRTPQSMGNRWIFWNCTNLPETLPNYLYSSQFESDDVIGYGLNEKLSNEIKQIKNNYEK